MTAVLKMWTVYDHPIDYPDRYVARLYEWSKPTETFIASPNLDTIREFMMECGLIRMERTPGDDPVIVEVWL